MQRLHNEQFKNYQSLIETERILQPKQNRKSCQGFAKALSENNQPGRRCVSKTQALKVAGTAQRLHRPWGKLTPEMAAVGVPPNPDDNNPIRWAGKTEIPG